jgi:hypothetical protein
LCRPTRGGKLPSRMTPDATRALTALLPRLIDAPALREFLLGLGDEGKRVADSIPASTVAPAQLFFEAVRALERRGLLRTAEFWNHLHADVGAAFKPEVAALALKFGVQLSATTPPVDSPASPPPPGPSPAASKITLLLVSASPDHATRLRVDIEHRRIGDKIRGSRHRDRFNVVQLQAARFEDLQTALHEHLPHVLHISSHGFPDGSLGFEAGDDGNDKVSKKRLLRLFKAVGDNLRVVFFNACHSSSCVCDMTPTVDLTIGMSSAVTDAAAIAFSAAFYEAIGFGRTVEKAFDAALSNLDVEDDEVPQLFPPADQDPDGKRQLKLLS